MQRTGWTRRDTLATGLAAAAITSLPARAPAATPAAPFFGVTGHFLHVDRFFKEQQAYWRVDRTLPLVRELGLRTVHEGLYAWAAPGRAVVTNGSKSPETLRGVEANRRQISDFLKVYDEAGIGVVLAVLGQAPGSLAIENNAEFAAWIADLVAAHPSVTALQLHNEPNLRSFWRGTPEEYVRTYRPFAEATRARRPDLRVYGGAISSLWWPQGVQWLKGAVEAGLLDFVDGIAVHPYNTTARPETDPHFKGAPASDPDQRERALHVFWKTLSVWNTARKPLDLVFTEFGYSTGKGLAEVPDEATQADYLSRSLLIYLDARLTGVPIRSVYWYDLKDDGQKDENLQHRFGLVSYDLARRKPAFDAYRAIAAAFPDVADLEPAPQGARTGAAEVKLKSWRRRSDGARIVAFWSLAPSSAPRPEASATTIELPGAQAVRARLQAADGSTPREVALRSAGGGAAVSVQPSGRAQWLVVPTR